MATQVMETAEKKESKSRVKTILGAIGAALLTYYGFRYESMNYTEDFSVSEIAECEAYFWGASML